MKIKEIFQSFIKLFAKFYNLLPQKVKIAVYVASSTIIASLLTLIIRDLTNMQISNEYLGAIVSGIIPILTIIVNIIQKMIVEYGTKLLAIDGDEKTLTQLDSKIETAESLVKLSK